MQNKPGKVQKKNQNLPQDSGDAVQINHIA